MPDQMLIAGISAVLIAVIHLAYPRLEALATPYKPIWVPLAGGIAIGYVFLYLMPKLADYTQSATAYADPSLHEFGQYRIFFYALLGFALYFAVDQSRLEGGERKTGVVLVHAMAFSGYSLLTGYLLANMPRGGSLPIVVGAPVLALHLVGINHQLRDWDRQAFDRYFRWLFAGAVIVGWTAGDFLNVSKEFLMLVTGILAGGIVANTMLEKLPAGQRHKLLPFFAGVTIFVAIAWVMRSLPKGTL